MLTICLLILIYSMLKKPVASLVAKIKDADWKRPEKGNPSVEMGWFCS